MIRYGWYGDDFTGATDTLAAVTRGGARAMLFLRVPDPALLRRAGALDAIGIAGAARSMAPAAMREALAPVGAFFAGSGVDVLHYKCCSTFDSAPGIGSIGCAVATLRAYVPNRFVPIVGGQPELGRYCAFSTLFAAAGAGGEVFRIDRHPTMARHPVTPMDEGDLRLHLARQGLTPVAAVHLPRYGAGLAAVDAQADGATLFDVTEDAQLAVIGELMRQRARHGMLLAVGPSSVATALFGSKRATTASPAAPGPVFVLVGSLSPVSRAQAEAAVSYTHLTLTPASFGATTRQASELLRQGRPVLVRTDRPAGPEQAAPAVMVQLTARAVEAVLRAGRTRRVVIAGGDTSSHAALSLGAPGSLGLWGLSLLGLPEPGVPLCRAHADNPALDGVELVLKGGQMGEADLFERLLSQDPARAETAP